MQIFILLYIEAGSYINDEEDGWEFVVLLVRHFFLTSRTLIRYLQIRKTETEGRNYDIPFRRLLIAVQLLLFPRKSATAIEVSQYSLLHSTQLIHEKPICHPSAISEARSWM